MEFIGRRPGLILALAIRPAKFGLIANSQRLLLLLTTSVAFKSVVTKLIGAQNFQFQSVLVYLVVIKNLVHQTALEKTK